MRKYLVCQLLAFCFQSLLFLQTSSTKQSAIQTLLYCENASCQRDALNMIVKNKVGYSHEVAQLIDNNYNQGGTYSELSTLLYVAALIKSKESLPIIQAIWLDEKRFEDDCIYCCARSLVLTVFGIHGLWEPPSLSFEQREYIPVDTTLYDIDKFKNYSPDDENREPPSTDGDGERSKEMRKALSMSDNQLFEITTNESATIIQRYIAAEELRRRISDDKHLVDYYWWALNPCEDDSGECLCFAHECILRAEFYNYKNTIIKNR